MDSDKLFTVDTEYVDSPQIASKKLFSVSNVVALYTMLGVVLLSVNAVRDRKKKVLELTAILAFLQAVCCLLCSLLFHQK